MFLFRVNSSFNGSPDIVFKKCEMLNNQVINVVLINVVLLGYTSAGQEIIYPVGGRWVGAFSRCVGGRWVGGRWFYNNPVQMHHQGFALAQYENLSMLYPLNWQKVQILF